MTTAAPKPRRSRNRILFYGAIAAAILAANWAIDRLSKAPQTSFKTVPLTDYPGAQTCPSLSPDGRKVAFAWKGEKRDDRFHIFFRPVAIGGWSAPTQLTNGAGDEISPAWSPDGSTVAFARLGQRLEYFTVPAGGGAEKKVADFSAAGTGMEPEPLVSWSRDGASLLATGRAEAGPSRIFRVPLAGGEPEALTAPPADTPGDVNPACSPDGSTFAFVRRAPEGKEDIWAAPLRGAAEPRRITFDGRAVRGLSWTPDGREIVYAGERLHGQQLWRVPASGGSPEQVVKAEEYGQYPSLARSGGRLVFTTASNDTNIWRVEVPEKEGAEPDAVRLISSPKREFGAQYSPDGRKIAFLSDRSGGDEIWVCDANGDNPAQLTRYKGPDPSHLRWSPDGRLILYELHGDGTDGMFTVPAAGGSPKRVGIDRDGAGGGVWSPDGKLIYYRWRGGIWKVPAEGGESVQVSDRDARDLAVSPDGKYLFYRGRSLWRIPASSVVPRDNDGEDRPRRRARGHMPDEDGGPGATRVDQPDTGWGPSAWAVTKRGVFAVAWDQEAHKTAVWLSDPATGRKRRLLTLEHASFGWRPTFGVSPDGRYILYSRSDVSVSHIAMIENFK